jgi:hypothetical protein
MLYLMIVEFKDVRGSDDLEWHNVHTKFCEIGSTGSEAEKRDTYPLEAW